jgi:L-threonylcarbamoyladenylate synthase
MILDGSQASAIATGAQALHRGDLLAFPTETVYGLGADAGNNAAVAKIFAAKGRPSEHPLIVHVAQASSVSYFASEVPAFARALIKAFWPGPLTLILPRRPAIAASAAGGQNSIGLRCPSHPVAQALLRACSELGVAGIAAPSANQFGRVSPTTAAHVAGEFDESLLILDGGPCDVGIESTIVDCTRGVPVLLRPGAITLAQIQAACGMSVDSPQKPTDLEAPAPRASGTLESHYAPNAKLRLMDATSLQAALNMMGKDLDQGKATIAVYARTILRIPSSKLLFRRMPDDAAATAQQLFAVLREFDAQGVKLIWVETPPDAPDWAGVHDRLSRAAA